MHNFTDKNWLQFFEYLPAGLAALGYLIPVITGGNYLWGTNLSLLTTAMQIEWLVIGGGLLFMPLMIIPVRSRVGLAIRGGAGLLLTVTFGLGAYTMNGWPGVFSFYVLLIVAYGGKVFFIQDPNRSAVLAVEFLLRWLVCLVLFFSMFAYFDPPQRIESWQGDASLLPYGAVFFSALFLMECAVYSWAFPKMNTFLRPRHSDSDAYGDAGNTSKARKKFYDAIRNK